MVKAVGPSVAPGMACNHPLAWQRCCQHLQPAPGQGSLLGCGSGCMGGTLQGGQRYTGAWGLLLCLSPVGFGCHGGSAKFFSSHSSPSISSFLHASASQVAGQAELMALAGFFCPRHSLQGGDTTKKVTLPR